MENASKALLIAGGVIIALMILSLLVYVGTSMEDMAKRQETELETKQLQEFNQSYEAYNKSLMHGIDVITVVNKAINHNKTIEATASDPYYINIRIKPKQTFETTIMMIKQNSTPVKCKIEDYFKNLFGNPSNNYKAYLESNKTYELGTWQENGESFVTNNNFLQFFAGDTIDTTVTKNNITYIMYSALTNFKTAVFKCTDVEYEQGRIKLMEFSQIK